MQVLSEQSLVESPLLPSPPTNQEKYSYVMRNYLWRDEAGVWYKKSIPFWFRLQWLAVWSTVSTIALALSQFSFAFDRIWLYTLLPFFGLTLLYQVVSLVANMFSYKFDLAEHRVLVSTWRNLRKSDGEWPSVSILLPIAGEPIEVLRNTWNYVRQVQFHYPGSCSVRVLDDKPNDPEVKDLALSFGFGFEYHVRPDPGTHKKAGNLKFGYEISTAAFLLILDADFCPREDILEEMLAYMRVFPDVGILQTPQFFRTIKGQNWLEQGAGAVQEIFYRVGQVARNGRHRSSICVGTCALYRRKAWEAIGGPVLIEHSEDVHNGVAMRKAGWNVVYIPICLACGMCPSNLEAFIRQQYRWCRGSMSLLMSKTKFWDVKMPFSGRLCYISGFLYYIYTAVNSVVFPIVPLVIVLLVPELANLRNYILLLPCLVYGLVFYPVWHRSKFGIASRATRMVFGWAHLFCLFDLIRRRPLDWKPTGAAAGMGLKKYQYITYARYIIRYWALFWGFLWVSGAIFRIATGWRWYNFFPIVLSGFVYVSIAIRATTGARD